MFVNVGRGDVVAEESLLAALQAGWLSGAILDVFEKEPLPSESQLWAHPSVVISPHVCSRSFAHETLEVLAANYTKFVANQSLEFEVNWETGY